MAPEPLGVILRKTKTSFGTTGTLAYMERGFAAEIQESETQSMKAWATLHSRTPDAPCLIVDGLLFWQFVPTVRKEFYSKVFVPGKQLDAEQRRELVELKTELLDDRQWAFMTGYLQAMLKKPQSEALVKKHMVQSGNDAMVVRYFDGKVWHCLVYRQLWDIITRSNDAEGVMDIAHFCTVLDSWCKEYWGLPFANLDEPHADEEFEDLEKARKRE